MTRLEGSWVIEPLRKDHDRAAFTCEENSLAQYIKTQASQDARRFTAAPFVAVTDGGKTVLGYYTLSSTTLELTAVPENIAKKLPRYPTLPATLLGRLARDQSVAGKGLGEFLLMDSLHRAYVQSKEIASAAVLVDAISHKAATFYRHFDFLEFADNPNRLFLPMPKIAKLFA
ncbi:N-acetyltransferase GCN5 [Hyphomicrobium denitrificans 1NES1]|uniref:N-acetyltransferase GCN5 n=1 Tax=Hyphomicrobium denitrificans 1NES1 TaxID=670307 RepID=N0AYT9_9HYPH|nr:hypothetical protein [Hyphomicrobium denitrificans]AGK56304.1 N-acetyltransferase GCN5 [Hyphomicrobium denitrificans 1NES1]